MLDGMGRLVGLATASATVVLAMGATAWAAPGAGEPAIVSLGDSFISGEGGRWVGNGTDPLGNRSQTDRAAVRCGTLGCLYEPELVYGTSEANDCHRSDVAPIESVPVAADR